MKLWKTKNRSDEDPVETEKRSQAIDDWANGFLLEAFTIQDGETAAKPEPLAVELRLTQMEWEMLRFAVQQLCDRLYALDHHVSSRLNEVFQNKYGVGGERQGRILGEVQRKLEQATHCLHD
jgi:hypothetical protein